MRTRLIVIILIMLWAVALALCSLCGPAHLSGGDLWHSDILWQLRMPRQVMALTVGAALAVCGTVYQSVFRNPLTDPYLLGISSGASLGAVLAILLGLDSFFFGIGLSALATALLTLFVIFRIALIGNRMHSATLLLSGVCVTLLIGAVVSFLMVMNHDKMDRIIFWTMGSFASVRWSDVAIVAPVVFLGTLLMRYLAKDLNLMLVGGDEAQSMGVDVERVKIIALGVTSLMVAFAVSACGVIGFVGLIVPHAARLLVGPDNRRLLPIAALGGGLFMLLCDTAARCLFQPAELPVGTLSAIIGAPLFICLIYRKKRLI